MIKADVHIHTNFSPDSKSEVCAYIQKAINLGFHSICITDHYDIIYLHEKFEGAQFVLNTNNYFKKLNSIKEEYSDKIEVLIGIEMGLYPHLKDQINDYLNKYNFDFVIGSSHFIENTTISANLLEKYSEREMVLKYFEASLKNVRTFSNYDVYGHLDFIFRHAPNETFNINNYKDIISEILKNIIKNNKGIEINTRGLLYNLKYPNPHKDILKMYKEFGGEIITVGSDAHESAQLGYKFKNVENLMKEIGFKYYSVYQNRLPKFYRI